MLIVVNFQTIMQRYYYYYYYYAKKIFVQYVSGFLPCLCLYVILAQFVIFFLKSLLFLHR